MNPRKPVKSIRERLIERVTHADNQIQYIYNAANWAKKAIDAKAEEDYVKPRATLDAVIADYKVRAYDLAVSSAGAYYAPDGTPIEPDRYIAGPGCLTLCWDIPGTLIPHLFDAHWENLIPEDAE